MFVFMFFFVVFVVLFCRFEILVFGVLFDCIWVDLVCLGVLGHCCMYCLV